MRSKYYIFHSLLVVGLIVIATMLIWHGTATGKNVPLNNSYLSTATNSTAITATSTPSQGSPVSTITPKPANTPVSSKIAIQETAAAQGTTTAPIATPIPRAELTVGTDLYSLPVHDNQTLLQAMQALQTSSSFTYSGREYTGLGFFVTAINGKSAANGFNWMLYVNGKPAESGASAFIITAGQNLEWKYEK
jgi:hypothetical protein